MPDQLYPTKQPSQLPPTGNRTRRRPSGEPHQQASRNLHGSNQQHRKLFPPKCQTSCLPPNSPASCLPYPAINTASCLKTNNPASYFPTSCLTAASPTSCLCQQPDHQMPPIHQPAASQPGMAIQSGNSFNEHNLYPCMLPSFQSALDDHVPQSIKENII
ncbi:hypothetical protein DPMN_141333 [Dreissena polymorpha]|uniref:Uncharacterized protein n=1 Tax=Dreissena polymorpha TaxID=45954 RepID=A0A9D4G999_DREPO|nr:hypothetical protein DPMN_141333 [Dreissena polymorpha]